MQKKIIDFYQPDSQKCRATVNPDIDNSQNRDNLEIACMIAGYKNIYFTRWPEIIQNLDPRLLNIIEQKKFKKLDYTQYYLSKAELINNQIIMVSTWLEEKKTLIFNSKGKKNALLFYLHDLQLNIKEFQSPGSWAESNNPFLIGSLLEYNLDDIEFYYTVDAFKDSVNHKTSKFNKPFVKWHEKLKQRFYLFKNNLWQNSENYKIYLRDKQEFTIWFEQHSNLTLRKLEATIKDFEKQLSKYLI